MTRVPGDVAAFILAALCVVAIAILAGLAVPVPEVLITIALVSVGAGGGAAIPRTRPEIPQAPVEPASAGVGIIPR